MGDTLYIVWSEEYGDVSYWLTEEEAEKEVQDLISAYCNGDASAYDVDFGWREKPLGASWISQWDAPLPRY